jgi:HD-GYP domain-containing protein (c-di-GMP phosphodiesterase class II)
VLAPSVPLEYGRPVEAGRGEARLAELIAALSLATDLGMGQPLEQALRYCVLAVELGRRLGCEPATLSDVYYLSLLEHVGCTATAPEMAEWHGGDELAYRERAVVLGHASMREYLGDVVRREGAGRPLPSRAWQVVGNVVGGMKRFEVLVALQCEGADRLAERLGTSDQVRHGLRHFYARWDGKGAPRGIAGDDISLAQRIVTVAHDAVAHARLDGVAVALEVVERRRGGAYDPAVCDALLSDPGSLKQDAVEGDVWERALDAEPEPVRTIAEAELDSVARSLADFADLKTPFLMGHSQRVGVLAAAAARELACPAELVASVGRAGFLHDLGRLGVPNGIWCKPGELTTSERERVRLHPYFTERILARASALAPYSLAAAAHHERLDGSGYHRGIAAPQLPLEARLLCVADAYDAMTHERPHRPALDAERVRSELAAEVETGRQDRRAVDAVLAAGHAQPLLGRRHWPAGLSDREVEVLALLARGKTRKEIAAELVIAPKTVGRHVENIYAKTGLSTRAGAALFASEHGLLD